MAKTEQPATPPPSRLQRILAFMFAAVILMSLVALILILVAGGIGVDPRTGVWPIIFVLPLPGLSIAVLLLIALLVVTAVRRTQAARDARN
jgi:hypothetical protein